MEAENILVEMPAKALVLFIKIWRYIILHGGRGSGKSHSVAKALIVMAAECRLRILCVREFQLSIAESVHQLLVDQIALLGLQSNFRVTEREIIGINGSQFIFAGIRSNPEKIKSTEGVDICWVEEADKVSEKSWKLLTPTIRKPGSQIFVTFNPDDENDPASKRFLINPSPDMLVVQMNWRDNPWFPEVLRKEMEWDFKVDPIAARHTWEGEYSKRSKASILGDHYRVESFEPQADWDGPYYGGDWGFATDPATLVKMWRCSRLRRVYIEAEVYEVGLPITGVSRLWSKVSGAADHIIRADSARPEIIYHMTQVCSRCHQHVEHHGELVPCPMGFKPWNVIATQKWPGSVEDGITWLKRMNELIIVHPSCIHTNFECKHYSYKVDRLTGDVLAEIVDKHNHCIDPIRYGFDPIIKVADQEAVIVYDGGSSGNIDPDLDEFELRQQLAGNW
jgi:phage terminase large subunit